MLAADEPTIFLKNDVWVILNWCSPNGVGSHVYGSSN